MPRKDKIRTIQEGPRAQRHGQSDPEVRPADDQDVRSVHGERIFPPLRVVGWYECCGGFFSWQAAMVVDIRFQQLFGERAQSTPVQVAMPLPMGTPTPMRTLSAPTSMPIAVPTSVPITPINVEEPQPILLHPLPYPQFPIAEPSTLRSASSHVRQPSASSSITLFVIVLISLFSVILTFDLGLIPARHGLRSSSDATQR